VNPVMKWKRMAGEFLPLLLIWIGLLLLFGLLSNNFLSASTMQTLANQVPPLTIVACGMTLVLIIAGIDLSVGSVMALCSGMMSLAFLNWSWPIWLAIAFAIAVGCLAGLFNGGISVALGIPSFIVTLGMLEIARGLAYVSTGSETRYVGLMLEPLIRPLPGLGVPPSFLIAVVVVCAGQYLLSRTVYGRYLVAIGSNENAVRLAGIPTGWKKVMVFVITGGLVGLASVFPVAKFGSADPNAAVGFELSAIAAVVIGGTSLMGGRGSVVNSFIGVLIMTTLIAGLSQMGVGEPAKRMVTGAVIILAVSIDALRSGLLGRLWARFRKS